MNRNKILVPIDLKQDSISLLRYSSSIARSMHARITFLNVMADIPGDRELAEELQTKKLISRRRLIELQLAEIVTNTLKNEKLFYEIIVTKGDLYQRIASISDEFRINMIILNESAVFDVPKLSKLVSIPLILYSSGIYGSCKNMLFPMNIEDVDYRVLDELIHIAGSLNTTISILSYSLIAPYDSSWEYNSKLDTLKDLIEKENISCVIKSYSDIGLVYKEIENLVSDGDTDILLIMHVKLITRQISLSNNSEMDFENFQLPILVIPENTKNRIKRELAENEHYF